MEDDEAVWNTKTTIVHFRLEEMRNKSYLWIVGTYEMQYWGEKIKFEYNVRQWEELVLLLPDSFTGITL